MQLVMIRKRNVNDPTAMTETCLMTTCKKRKGAEKFLSDKAKELGIEDKWSFIRDTDATVVKGTEYAFLIVPITENAMIQPAMPLEKMFKTIKG